MNEYLCDEHEFVLAGSGGGSTMHSWYGAVCAKCGLMVETPMMEENGRFFPANPNIYDRLPPCTHSDVTYGETTGTLVDASSMACKISPKGTHILEKRANGGFSCAHCGYAGPFPDANF